MTVPDVRLITTFPLPGERNAPISSASPPQKSVFSSVETVFVLWLSEVPEEPPEEVPEEALQATPEAVDEAEPDAPPALCRLPA